MGRGGGMGNPVNVGIAVQADWENREFISNISLNVRRLFDFLLRFGGGVALLYDTKEIDKISAANEDEKIGVQIIKNSLKVAGCLAMASQSREMGVFILAAACGSVNESYMPCGCKPWSVWD